MAEVWKDVAKEPPPGNTVVDTFSPGGLQQELQRIGRLWFFPDGSMYVYYTPQYWRPVESKERPHG